MTQNERALQVWAVLALAAHNRQVLTHDIVSRLVGAPMPALAKFLEPIQTFCLKKNLPPLSILVVSRETENIFEDAIPRSRIPSFRLANLRIVPSASANLTSGWS